MSAIPRLSVHMPVYVFYLFLIDMQDSCLKYKGFPTYIGEKVSS